MNADATADDELFSWPVRVYYEDTDLSGVVYHANYLKFFERARTEWLRALGFGQDQLLRDAGVAFTLTGIEVEFRKPARLDDELAVSVRLNDLKRASFRLSQTIERLAAEGRTLLAVARTRVACVDAARFAPRALPQAIADRIAARHPALAANRI